MFRPFLSNSGQYIGCCKKISDLLTGDYCPVFYRSPTVISLLLTGGRFKSLLRQDIQNLNRPKKWLGVTSESCVLYTEKKSTKYFS